MNTKQWRELLEPWSFAAIARVGDEPTAGPLGGLGLPGASDDMLEVTEQRLGARLPPSYRNFLQCTNGLHQPRPFVAGRGGDFWSAEEIDWFPVRNQSWIDAYTQESYDVPDELYFVYGALQDPVQFRAEYLRDCLEISHDGDSAVCLLNPRVVGASGEWEAWFFANWNPGAVRYRTFAELMVEHHEGFLSTTIDGF